MRTKNSAKTFIYGIVLTTIIAILGLFKTKVLLQYLGDDSVGVYQLFYQLFLYVSLIDSGLTAAITYRLYKPINEANYRKINELLSGAKDFFSKIGIAVIIIGIILSFFIMSFIKDTQLDIIYIQIAFIIFIIASSTSYFISARTIRFEAEQKLYKTSSVNYIMTILKTIMEIILAMMGFKLLTLLLMFLVLTILRNIVIVNMSKRNHPELNLKATKDKSFIKESKYLIIQKINALIFDNTDIILISKFLGLLSVVIYAAYYQIINMLTLIVKRISSATLAGIGNLLVDQKSKAQEVFYEMNSLLFFIANTICIPLFFMITPFIGLWFGDRYTASSLVSLLFIFILYMNVIKIPLEVFMNASGEFKNIRNAAIYQSVTNITLSIILINILGIAGVLIATLFAFLTGNFIFYPIIIHKKIFNVNTRLYYLKILKYLTMGLSSFLVINIINSYLYNTNILLWFANGSIIFIINFIFNLGLFKITNELLFINRVKFLIDAIKGKTILKEIEED